MRTTRTLSILLPYEMDDYIRAKVSTGEFATKSEVIRVALRTLIARDRVVEAWLRDAVNPGEFALDLDSEWAADVIAEPCLSPPCPPGS
ncbi:type II toxin-antitoxin system ParD family antitoxin [Burkholderia ambifaria]|uniref:ribbon-helix-helix domain-containing protein n=1 Tax=Burkholderia ambifaria TaxID=152480 RepID=UPI001E4CCDCF|nr:type II toxin-antitoxin system ParD family antitoxin [Burkholderia ambifaria]UEP25344.1 type II toxin-antitoxin system ParD family antitoxin [Burkholderia ambifaria]